ncbi:IQ calmodulin-binding motif-containing protein [Nitzschia inconspicua]|uniref:IQ calmodulin-binding motif-containing protein n=1 Tax=Nitzschia inconspicua TaxID=303405 RepID=A0A9K3Q8R5_9STRA|nr:IQ calmodulin-binding motif-containing protein [Nitzschia inconspicua]
MTSSFSSIRRNSFDDKPRAGVPGSASPSRNSGGYRGFSGGTGGNANNNHGRRSFGSAVSNSAAESQHFFPSNGTSPREVTNSRSVNIVSNVNHQTYQPSSSANMAGRRNSDQLAHQKDQWNVERDIPTGTVRNNPFLPQPKPQPPQPVQLMHQKKQWDTSNIPRGSVAARTHVMEIESPRNNNGSRPSRGSGTWQPQPIPVNLESSSSPAINKRRSFSPKQIRPTNVRPNETVNNVTRHSSSMRGQMIETGGARPREPAANVMTGPKWEPSREIPKGTVKGRMNILFREEHAGDHEKEVMPTSSSGSRGYKNFITPSDSRSTSMQRNKDTTKQRRPKEEVDEDPWIIPDRKISSRKAYRDEDWGEGAVVSSASAESDDWDAPTKEWFQSESQSSEEDLFEEARPAKKKNAREIPAADRSRTEYEGPKKDNQFAVNVRGISDSDMDDRNFMTTVDKVQSPPLEQHQQLKNTFHLDRDAEILQAAKEKQFSPFLQGEKPRHIQDSVPRRKPVLAPPSKDVSAYHHRHSSPQPKVHGDDKSVRNSVPQFPEQYFTPFGSSFHHQAAKEALPDGNTFGQFLDARDVFLPVAFPSTKEAKAAKGNDAFGFPTSTSATKVKSSQEEDEAFFDAVASMKYEGPPSISASQKIHVSSGSTVTLKPEQESRSITPEKVNDLNEDAGEEPKKKKKGGFFKGLFGGRKGKDKDSSKKNSSKTNRRRDSHGSIRDKESTMMNSQSATNRDSSDHGIGQTTSVDRTAQPSHTESFAENYVEPRSGHVMKGRSEDDTTISEMTNPTVFKDHANPPTLDPPKKTRPPPLSSPVGGEVVTPRTSPEKAKLTKEATTPRRGNLVVIDIKKDVNEDAFVDPELDHLNMNTSEEDSLTHQKEGGILKVVSSEPPPPPSPKVSQKNSTSLATSKTSSRFNSRQLRETNFRSAMAEEKKSDDDSLSIKSKDKSFPAGKRLSGSRYIKRKMSLKEQENQMRLNEHPANVRNLAISTTISTPRSRLRSMSPASRSLKQSSRETVPVPQATTKMLSSMSPPLRLQKVGVNKMKEAEKIQVSSSQEFRTVTHDRVQANGVGKHARKPSFLNKHNSSKPTAVSKNTVAGDSIFTGTALKQECNVNQTTPAIVVDALQSPFARRLAARKSKDLDSGTASKSASTAKSQNGIPPGSTVNDRGGTSRYDQSKAASSNYSNDKRKRVVIATSMCVSNDKTIAPGSTFEAYQKKLKESLNNAKRNVSSSDHSIHSIHSNRSADSSIGSDIRVLKTILRRPRLGNDYDDVIKISQQNEGFQTYNEKNITDPMQRVGLRLLSGAIIPIQTEVRRFLATRKALTRMWALIVIQTYARRMLARRWYEDSLYAVVTIQRFLRGYNTRVDVISKHVNAIQIQRIVRGYLATIHVYEEIYKVTLVQSWIRMKIAMDNAAYRMAHVIQVQAVARGFLQRRRLCRKATCATVIQASWRCFYDRLTYQFDLLDIIIVQSLWRRKIGMREAKKRLDSLHNHSATVIQTAWRSYDCKMDYICYLAARDIQTKWRSYICSRNYNEYKAARKIQSAWRSYDCRMDYICYLAARMIQSNWRAAVCREQYLYNIAAKMIQTRWRAHLCRQDYVNYMAARMIQSNWRAARCREQYLLNIAAKMIQARWRAHVCRQDYVNYMAARMIQARWRARVCRLAYVQYMAARMIQARWRAYVCRLAYVQYMAARMIQARWRACVCRQDYVQYIAARMIQARWRAHVCREDYVHYMAARMIQARWRARVCRLAYVQYMAARKIQTSWRASVCRQDYIYYLAATVIQAGWRSSICRKEYVAYMAARTIQTNWRASVCRQDYLYYLAARVIQTNWRSSVCRKDYISYVAARTIQTNWRCSVCRKDYVAYTAARTIQKIWRSSACRKDYVAYMAARTIQTSWRAAVCREFYLQNVAAKIIQTKWRGFSCIKEYVAFMAARKIQTSWRAYVCRRDFIDYFAATIIQAKWRSFVLRTDYLQYKAAMKIQSAWRSYDCKMNYLHFLADILIIQSTYRRYKVQKHVTARKNEAATLIQKSWRGFACFADYQEYKVARKIQSAWRGYVCKAFYKEYLAARKIQAAWRCFVCYADYQEFLTVRKIQSFWRGYIRRNAFKRYLAARKIQSLWRGFVQFADFHEYLTVRRIQTAWRGYTCRSTYKRYQAATRIQSAWRGCVAFAAYQDYQAATRIQSAWRGCVAFAAYQEWLAVRRVQRAWRAYSITKKAKEEEAARTLEAKRERAAVTIQSHWRGFVTYADYMFAVADIVVVQKMVRGLLARRRFKRKRADARLNAAVTIQKNWRRFVDETEFVVMKYEYQAARTIQTCWRRFWCFSNFIIALDCSIQIQAQVRGYLYRKGFGTQRTAAITLQTAFRTVAAKQTAHKFAIVEQLKNSSIEMASTEYTAATKIQCIYRGTVSRTALKVYLAAVKIQSQFRAGQARVAVRLYLMSRKIQKTWRGYNPRRAFVTFVAARRIQNKWRCAKANQTAIVLRGERLAATLIQSAWRGFVCYTDYVFTLSDVVSAQRIARGYLSRKKYSSVIRSNMIRKREELNAAILIQRTSRGFQARQKYWYTLGCTMQIQSWWRGSVAKNAVKKQFEAVSTLQCFARRCLARQQYLQRKFIYMLINTAEKEKTRKGAVGRMHGQSRDHFEQRLRDEAARVIQRFFLRVKYEVDQLVRAQQRRKKWKKKIVKAKKCPDNVEDSLLEDAWEAAISYSNLDEEPFTRSYSNMGSGSVIHMDTRSIASLEHESLNHVETGSITMAHPVTAAVLMDPPGSVASSNLRGSTTGSRSQYRRQQEEMRYRLPPVTIHTKRPSSVARMHRDGENDDTSVFSQLTGSTMTFARPAHVRVVRKVPVSQMEDEFQLEEAFIDAEIFHAKERRQLASTYSRGHHQLPSAPRPSRKSTGGISGPPGSSSSRRVSHDGIGQTNSRGGDSVASNDGHGHKGGEHRRQSSGFGVLASHGNYEKRNPMQ